MKLLELLAKLRRLNELIKAKEVRPLTDLEEFELRDLMAMEIAMAREGVLDDGQD